MQLTKEEFAKMLPAQFKAGLTTEVMDNINNTMNDPDLCHNFRDTLVTYTSVLNGGRYKITDYINAVKFVSHLFLGSNNLQAYMKTFPERYKALVDSNTSAKDISSYVSAYKKNKLVTALLEQNLIPAYVRYQDIFHSAVVTQYDIMQDEDASFKVRSDAANSLMTQLRQPEKSKVEMDVTIKEDTGITDLKRSLAELAAKQVEAIESGAVTTKEIAHSNIVIDNDTSEVIN